MDSRKIRTDGYFFCEKEIKHQYYYPVIFIYKNGVVLNSGCLFNQKSSVTKIDSCLKIISNESYKKFKDNWGVIQIKNDEIEVETWYSKDFQSGRGTKIKKAKILNDKTIIFNQIKSLFKNESNLLLGFNNYK